MKAKYLIPICFLFSSFNEQESAIGSYNFESRYYVESIILKNNNKFHYSLTSEFLKIELDGNFNIHGDSLTLDSNPQRDRMIVTELRKKQQKSIFKITDKTGHEFGYSMEILLENDSTIKLKDQWAESAISGKIKGFYMIDTKGLKSPFYKTKGQFSNYFNILFETNKTFENETWIISNDEIKPKGLDGSWQNYILNKQK
jgi:hypothetical protein